MVATSDSTRSTKVQIVDQGDSLVVKSGGIINLETGAKLEVNGVDVTSSAAGSGVAGAAAGYKLARSAAPVALDGSNPTSVAHGLTTCLSAHVQLVGSAAPGLGTSTLTCVINGANIDVYGWKPTGAGDTTLIASTGTETFNWQAIGT
jgi:hypothetical protein